MAWNDTKVNGGTLTATEWNNHVTDQESRSLVSSGTVAPTTTPGSAGDIYVDTTNNKVYVATGVASSADWDSVDNSVLSVNGEIGSVVLTTSDIGVDADYNYVTDAQLVVIGNTSGTNTGDQTITLTGDVTGSGTGSFTTTIGSGVVDIAMLSATGTASSTTYLRGDNTWATVSAGGSAFTLNRGVNNEVTTGLLRHFVVPDELAGKDIKEVRIGLLALPVGQALKVQVYRNGTASTDSIFTSDVAIEIGTGQSATNGVYMTGCDVSAATVGTPGTTIDAARNTLVADDVIYVEVTQVGSTTSGSDLDIAISIA